MGVFDRSNKAPRHTDCNAKNHNSLQYKVAEKIKKKAKKNQLFSQKLPLLKKKKS